MIHFLLIMTFNIRYKSTCVRFGRQMRTDVFTDGAKKPRQITGPIRHLELVLFASEIRRAFFEKGSDAFLKVIGFARFDLAFMFQSKLGR